MRRVRERILKVARSMAPGAASPENQVPARSWPPGRRTAAATGDKPFVAVNCGAIPEGLLEAEFFGAKKGPTPVRTQNREGFFQTAHGGTLFLDEIGDLPLAMQVQAAACHSGTRRAPCWISAGRSRGRPDRQRHHKNLASEVQQAASGKTCSTAST